MKERVLFIFPPKQVGIRIVPNLDVGLMDLYATRTFSRVVPFVKAREGIVWIWMSDIFGYQKRRKEFGLRVNWYRYGELDYFDPGIIPLDRYRGR